MDIFFIEWMGMSVLKLVKSVFIIDDENLLINLKISKINIY